MRITANYDIPDERVQDLLCNAFEGGSNYWYQIMAYNFPKGQTKESLKIEFPHLELPFKGGSLTIKDCDENGPKNYILDITFLCEGMKIMAEKYPIHFADFINENDDSITGDVFLQCCLFGEVIYG